MNRVTLVPNTLQVEIQPTNNIDVWGDFYIVTEVPAYVKACHHIIDHIGLLFLQFI